MSITNYSKRQENGCGIILALEGDVHSIVKVPSIHHINRFIEQHPGDLYFSLRHMYANGAKVFHHSTELETTVYMSGRLEFEIERYWRGESKEVK